MNNYLNIKDAQKLYNTTMSELVGSMKTNKPRVKFYNDGSQFFTDGWANPTNNEVYGKYWLMGVLGSAECAFWGKL